MDSWFTYFLYILAAVLLGVSFWRDKKKTIQALKKAWMMFTSVLPQFLLVILIVGFALSVFNANTIKQVIGAESGIVGTLVAAVLGSVLMVPALAALPVAAELLKNGAGLFQIVTFISTLTTVGLVTISIEIKYLGKKVGVLRNALFFLFSFFAAFVVYMVIK